MRFLTVFTLVCWVFLATVYLPIASADDGDDDDDGSGAPPAAPDPAAPAIPAALANLPPPTGPKVLRHEAASPSEFPPCLPLSHPPTHPTNFYFLCRFWH